tara:strand:- start:201 stop:764 length:564 start_codon:yes stop_codon:yes gene_type:complete
MKKLLFILLLSPLSYAKEVSTSFSLSCTVTDQVLLQSVDGVPKRYSAFEGGLKNGDNFVINFEYLEYTAIKSFTFKIKSEALNLDTYMIQGTGVGIPNGIKYEVRFYEQMIFEDRLELENIFSSEISLKRYYKDDWHLAYATGIDVGNTGHLLTANCLNMSDKWDDVIEKIKKEEESTWNNWMIDED